MAECATTSERDQIFDAFVRSLFIIWVKMHVVFLIGPWQECRPRNELLSFFPTKHYKIVNLQSSYLRPEKYLLKSYFSRLFYWKSSDNIRIAFIVFEVRIITFIVYEKGSLTGRRNRRKKSLDCPSLGLHSSISHRTRTKDNIKKNLISVRCSTIIKKHRTTK